MKIYTIIIIIITSACNRQWSWRQHCPRQGSATSWPWTWACLLSGSSHRSWWGSSWPGHPHRWAWTSCKTSRRHSRSGDQQEKPRRHDPSDPRRRSWYQRFWGTEIYIFSIYQSMNITLTCSPGSFQPAWPWTLMGPWCHTWKETKM